MFKFTSHLTNTHIFLVKRQIHDGTCAVMVRRSPLRKYATGSTQFKDKCPPAQSQPKSRKFLISAVGVTVLTGATVYYVKNSPKARSFLEVNAPWANDFVAFVFQENQTYLQFTVQQLTAISGVIRDFLFGKEGVTPMDFQQRCEQDLEKDAEKQFVHDKPFELPPPVLAPLYVEVPVVKTPEIEEPSTIVRTEKCVPNVPVQVKVTKDIVALEKDMQENTKKAVESYKEALKLCKIYNRAVFNVVEAEVGSSDMRVYNSVKGSRNQRDTAVKEASEASDKAMCAIENLDRLIRENKVQAPPSELAVTKRFINEFRDALLKEERAYKEEEKKSVLADTYWDQISEARQKYKTELETLFPGMDLCARQLIVNDADLLLLYTMRQIHFLQNQLAESQTIRDIKLQRAIDCLDEKAMIEVKVEDEVAKAKLQKEEEYQKKVLAIEADAKNKLREALKKQYETQMDVLKSKLAAREKEINSQFGKELSQRLEKERLEFKKDLAALAAKLQAMEAILKQRATQEAALRRSQSVWAAAEALLAATRRACAHANIDKEVGALENAGKGDKLVESVLNSITPDMRKKGIITEKSLKDKFDEVEKTTYKVALIGRDGASLPIYFLSWLQSKILFQKLAEIPQDELNNLPIDFTQLDTFEIMQRARYYMDQNNLSHALRYVNLLQGAPRAAACSWLDAARKHLEVKQAAEAVMAHATLSAMPQAKK